MVKGFKDNDGKFHPITDYKKGTRKSRDQNKKTEGIRMNRGMQLTPYEKYMKNLDELDFPSCPNCGSDIITDLDFETGFRTCEHCSHKMTDKEYYATMEHSKRMKRETKFKNGDKIIFHGKHTVLNTKLPEDRSGQGSCVSYSNQPMDEEITYVVSKSDTDGHLFYHWENSKGETICWTGNEAGFAQSDLARRTKKFAFRTDYRNGLQYNLNPNEFGVEKQ